MKLPLKVQTTMARTRASGLSHDGFAAASLLANNAVNVQNKENAAEIAALKQKLHDNSACCVAHAGSADRLRNYAARCTLWKKCVAICLSCR